jgi:tetratricopeptide (TPR) repeat protein
MMKSKNLKTLSSIFAAIIFVAGCSSQKLIVGMHSLPMVSDENQQNWYGTDISKLPFSNNQDALSEIANALCNRFAPFGQKIYAMRLAVFAHELDKKNNKAALALSRAAFHVADSIEGDEAKTNQSAEMGVKAARIAGINESNPEACYYFALNQGLLVQKKGLSALSKLQEIFDALKISQKVEAIDYGGPRRVLGMLYLKAPAWPSGIGDLDKALELLEQSIKQCPYYPQNFIFYAEALIEDDNKEKAMETLEMAHKLAVPEIWGVFYSTKWRAEIEVLNTKLSKK